MDPVEKECLDSYLWTVDTPTKLTDVYGQWSKSYDRDIEGRRYNGPVLLAKSLAEFYPEERRSVKILDIGAGTGFVGVKLQKHGFYNIDGLDPSQPMLDRARDKHVYTNLLCQCFTAGPTPGLEKDSYDVIISSGSLLRGHLPTDCFIEVARIARPGGVICMVTRIEGTGNFNEPDYRDEFKAIINRLEEQSKLKGIKWDKVNYNYIWNGILMAYRVLK